MNQPIKNLKIDGNRLWDSIHEIAKIGPGIAGGSNRQTLTDEDAEARSLFQTWCEDAGLTMSVDQMGTMFMHREGQDAGALPVYVGSHLDTQPTGGRYDGVLGVLAGLEIVKTLNDHGIKTKRPIVVTNWTNEEGTRFPPSMMASAVFAGELSQEDAYEKVDAEGKRFGDELERIGWRGEETVGARKMHAFFELHIEQGPILEAEKIDIGVVTHGQGLRWIECTVLGTESHAGSTPMPMRQNAGRGLAQITELLNEVVMAQAPNAVGTIGHVEVYPNSRNIVPGKAVFTIDIRSHKIDILNAMVDELLGKAEEICDALNLKFSHEIVGKFDPPEFDQKLVQTIRDASERLGYSHRDIISGAGHDACWINQVAPTAMVMCPCVDGLSHNEAEEISKEWSTAGAEVLFHAVLEAAEIVD